MREFTKKIPNIVTFARILSASVLLFSSAYSVLFYVTFSICALSDMLDGFLARVLDAKSVKGAKLDSFADLVFLIFTAVVIIPAVDFSTWVWIIAGIIAFIKLLAILIAGKKGNALFAPHNVLNKLTGLTLCIAVILFNFVNVESVCIAVSVISGVSAIYDFIVATIINLRGKADIGKDETE